MSTRSVPLVPAAAMVAIAALLLGCGGDDDTTAPPSSTTSTTTTTTSTTSTTTTAAATTTTVAPVEITEASFRNINDMTPVRGFFVDNLLGDLEATVAVAESLDGGVYPVGSLVQLFPVEAMVKREPGFSPATNDWEFFELTVSAEGTSINVRGGAEVINQFGLSCADCHAQAEPQFDFICEDTHGCEPLPIGRDFIDAAQAADPRPRVG